MKKFLILLALFVAVTALFGKVTGHICTEGLNEKMDNTTTKSAVSTQNPALSSYRSDVPEWLLRSIIVDR